MKKVFSIALALVMIIVSFPITIISSFAETSGNWEYTVENGNVTLTKYTGTESSVIIPSIIDGCEVVALGAELFKDCSSIKSISVPDCILDIQSNWLDKNNAFTGCQSLESISVSPINPNYSSVDGVLFDKELTKLIKYPQKKTDTIYNVPNTVKTIDSFAFSNCVYLTELFIPDSVTTIGKSAFSECTIIQTVSLPSRLTKIENGLFDGCSSLKDIIIPSSVTSIGRYAFRGCTSLEGIIIPSSVTSIGAWAFNGCTSVKDLILNEGLKDIANSAFDSMKSITEVIIPETVTRLGAGAFGSCSSLESVRLSSGLTEIEWNTFNGCSSLSSIIIPEGVTKIGTWAFRNCTSLSSVYITDLEKWCGISFVDNPLTNGANLYCNDELITDLVIPDSVKSVPENAFVGCTSIQSVVIPNSVNSIGSKAFYNCTSLQEITISGRVTEIADNSFKYQYEYYYYQNYSITKEANIPVIIYGYDNSYAQTYANTNGFKFVSLGEMEFVAYKLNYVYGDTDFAEIIGCYGIPRDLIFHSSEEGSCVVGIGEAAFKGRNTINSISFEEECSLYIEAEAFADCINLKNISISDGIWQIGKNAFSNTGAYNTLDNWDNHVLYIDKCLIVGKNLTSDTIVVKDGTRIIADNAFENCSNLKTVSISDSVNQIGIYAFHNCGSLISVSLPNNLDGIPVSCFEGCSSLKSIMLPDGIWYISSDAFDNCSSLNTLYLPQSIDWIAGDAFDNCNELNNVTLVYNPDCDYSAIADKVTDVRFNEATSIVTSDMISGFTNLKKVEILDGVTEISNKAFYNNKTVEEIVVSGDCIKIGDSAFENCDSLRKVSINNGVQYIGENAFKNCKKISEVFLPDSITVIGSNAFSDCTALKNITLSNNLTEIKDGAFMGCAFTSITIPNKVTKIGDNAFFNCGSLKSITLPDSVESIGEWSFADCDSLATFTAGDGLTVIGPSSFSGCAKLAKVVTGSGLLTVEESAFFQCSALSDVQLGDNVQDIWYWAFGECTSLEYIELPSQLSFLGKRAFSDCTSLKSIIIPDGVSQINEMTFYGCTSLKKVVFGKYTNAIGKAAFCDCSNLTSIRFPVRCNSIGDLAFGNCSKLSNISFSNVTNVSVGKFAFSGCPRLTNVYLPCPYNGGDNILLNGCFGYSSSGSKLNINIYGYNNSEAQTYAKNNGFKFYSLDYPDVASNAWFYNAVKYCTVRRDITGYKNGNFGPGDNLKRQDFVVILARIAGADLSKYENVTSKMPDVVKGSYYAAAVNWAVDNKIISGYQNGKFGVGDNITREQVCTILYRYMGSPQVTNVEKTLKSFNDSGKISSFSKDAVVWAIQNKVISGKNATTLAPTATASRAEIATIIMRMDENFMFYGYIY